MIALFTFAVFIFTCETVAYTARICDGIRSSYSLTVDEITGAFAADAMATRPFPIYCLVRTPFGDINSRWTEHYSWRKHRKSSYMLHVNVKSGTLP